jgi:hypothetical protein
MTGFETHKAWKNEPHFGKAIVLTILGAIAISAFHAQPVQAQSPILVELFTSEGCSSCPPADVLLAQLAKNHANIIALSEHVSYWNSLGWKDPFSSEESTQRQEDYARRFGGEGPYTPQMVVNGSTQFVGSDARAALNALSTPSTAAPIFLSVIQSASPNAGKLTASVKLDHAPAKGRLIAVLVQNRGSSAVARGENGGRTLIHVDIAREFRTLASLQKGQAFAGETSFALPANPQGSPFHVVAFFQASDSGPILAAASGDNIAHSRE